MIRVVQNPGAEWDGRREGMVDGRGLMIIVQQELLAFLPATINYAWAQHKHQGG